MRTDAHWGPEMSADYDPILHADACIVCGRVFDPESADGLCPKCHSDGWYFDETEDAWKQEDQYDPSRLRPARRTDADGGLL